MVVIGKRQWIFAIGMGGQSFRLATLLIDQIDVKLALTVRSKSQLLAIG